jgi:hypothetical protein
MSLQDALGAQLLKQVDLGKLAQQVLAKTDVEKMIKDGIAAIPKEQLFKAITDGLKAEIASLQNTKTADGSNGMAKAESLIASMATDGAELAALLAAAHAKK